MHLKLPLDTYISHLGIFEKQVWFPGSQKITDESAFSKESWQTKKLDTTNGSGLMSDDHTSRPKGSSDYLIREGFDDEKDPGKRLVGECNINLSALTHTWKLLI